MRVRLSNRRAGLVLAVALLLILTGGSAQAWADTTTTAPADQTTISPTTTISSATTTAETDVVMETPPGAIIPLAEGQTPPNPGWTTDLFEVRVLPEYDEPAVLIILRFSLPETVSLPATVKLPIPSGSWIAGIGEIGPGGGFTYNYADSYPTVEPGARWDIASIVVSDYRDLQVDYYYDPGIPDGAGQRSFPLLVQLPVDADTLILHVQQPARSTDFLIEPALQDSGLSDDGFTYAVAAYTGLKSGDQLGNTVSYEKSDGSLSIEGGTAPESSKVNTNTVLIAAILVVVVIVGGVVIYRLYAKPGAGKGNTKGRSRPRPAQPAPKAKASSRQASGGRPSGAKSSKAQTGKTTSSKVGNVDYCTACGEELDDRSRFCPNCGEARP